MADKCKLWWWLDTKPLLVTHLCIRRSPVSIRGKTKQKHLHEQISNFHFFTCTKQWVKSCNILCRVQVHTDVTQSPSTLTWIQIYVLSFWKDGDTVFNLGCLLLHTLKQIARRFYLSYLVHNKPSADLHILLHCEFGVLSTMSFLGIWYWTGAHLFPVVINHIIFGDLILNRSSFISVVWS